MYQSIEDEPACETDADAAPNGPKPRLPWVVGGVVLVALLLAGWTLAGLERGSGTVEAAGADPAVRTAYLNALSESDPALRRARLTDFLSQHPEHERVAAVQAQLGVLD
ncbi:MAG: hypothetical protein WBA35_12910, partial [Litorimonas sp.]